MKKVVSVFLVVVMLFLLCSCGKESKLAGCWYPETEEGGYPDVMTLNSDGTGSADGLSLNWSVDGNQLRLVVGVLGSYVYEYELDGDTLILDGNEYYRQ